MSAVHANVSPYHAGERAVQTKAGVRDQAKQVGKIVHNDIPDRAWGLLADQRFVVAGWRDRDGRVWASWLTGNAGFLSEGGGRLYVQTHPVDGDPLSGALRDGMWMGLLVIDLHTRDRLRVNGRLHVTDTGFAVEPDEVYPNCPKYIQQRSLRPSDETTSGSPIRTAQLTTEQQAWIADADTFFIASLHPETGADVSHRGGDPGFVEIVSTTRLAWPDYPGNNMFNTLGNIEAHPPVGLLFVDVEDGTVLQMTGAGRVIWDDERTEAYGPAERVVEVDISDVIEIPRGNSLRWELDAYSPFNP